MNLFTKQKQTYRYQNQIYGCCLVAKSPTLDYLRNCSTPDFPVLHYLPEFAQTHVH